MPHVVTRTSEFRPFKWIGYAALACVISFVLGMGAEQHNVHQSPPCTTGSAPTR